MLIAVDCDDVLADSMGVFIDYYNKYYNKSLTKNHFFTNLWWEVMEDKQDIVIGRYLDFIKSNYFDNIKPVLGAKEALKKLKQKHELIVVTGRPNSILKKTERWIENYFAGMFNGIYSTNLHFTSGKGLTKGDIFKEKKVDLLIDDYVEFGYECVANNINVLLMDQPWNSQAELPQGITRVKSWQDILDKID